MCSLNIVTLPVWMKFPFRASWMREMPSSFAGWQHCLLDRLLSQWCLRKAPSLQRTSRRELWENIQQWKRFCWKRKSSFSTSFNEVGVLIGDWSRKVSFFFVLPWSVWIASKKGRTSYCTRYMTRNMGQSWPMTRKTRNLSKKEKRDGATRHTTSCLGQTTTNERWIGCTGECGE